MAVLKDSGDRTKFESGAVRDLGEGKGRFDLVPLSVLSEMFRLSGKDELASIIEHVDKFLYTIDKKYLHNALNAFCEVRGWSIHVCALEVAKHFEDGANKYGTHNWEKGIPIHSFIDSAVRHLIQWDNHDMSDPHDRAFVWNMMCAIWTLDHKHGLVDTPHHTWDCSTPYTGFDAERSARKCAVHDGSCFGSSDVASGSASSVLGCNM